jgi:hypothetical protein
MTVMPNRRRVRAVIRWTFASAALACSLGSHAYGTTFDGFDFSLNGSSAMNGNNLDVGLNGFGVVGSAFINTPVTLTPTTSFIASYDFTMFFPFSPTKETEAVSSSSCRIAEERPTHLAAIAVSYARVSMRTKDFRRIP